jgi:hypothetical protein
MEYLLRFLVFEGPNHNPSIGERCNPGSKGILNQSGYSVKRNTLFGD